MKHFSGKSEKSKGEKRNKEYLQEILDEMQLQE